MGFYFLQTFSNSKTNSLQPEPELKLIQFSAILCSNTSLKSKISIANVLQAQSKKPLDGKPNFVFLTEPQNFGLKCFSLDVFQEMTKLAHPPTSHNLHLALVGKYEPLGLRSTILPRININPSPSSADN